MGDLELLLFLLLPLELLLLLLPPELLLLLLLPVFEPSCGGVKCNECDFESDPETFRLWSWFGGGAADVGDNCFTANCGDVMYEFVDAADEEDSVLLHGGARGCSLNKVVPTIGLLSPSHPYSSPSSSSYSAVILLWLCTIDMFQLDNSFLPMWLQLAIVPDRL